MLEFILIYNIKVQPYKYQIIKNGVYTSGKE